jgi:hypothetical protein
LISVRNKSTNEAGGDTPNFGSSHR